ncbi:hypothetical protein BO85DRAFT_170600 [Aspergillus piperis CBS 112811]|uniref:Uncharacterized protein n=1 Tax=Aspergillus piperis CBS 112811 TaxID=1448313 RepID=A0A8G1QR30_9EURO|nr:hypothetical protein BO85DRAFT_170600 [Aspergillus piperis CBS 112811]RAH52751.1 hypothetical protein BO85DRAFT_170600 [Aspergillus piperis CBS 112811]
MRACWSRLDGRREQQWLQPAISLTTVLCSSNEGTHRLAARGDICRRRKYSAIWYVQFISSGIPARFSLSFPRCHPSFRYCLLTSVITPRCCSVSWLARMLIADLAEAEPRSHDISSQDIPKFLLVPRLIQMKPTAHDAHVDGAILVAFLLY